MFYPFNLFYLLYIYSICSLGFVAVKVSHHSTCWSRKFSVCSRPPKVIVVEFILVELPAAYEEVTATLLLALELLLGTEWRENMLSFY